MDMKNAYAPVVIGVVVGLVVGFAVGWYWTESKYASTQDVETQQEQNEQNQQTESEDQTEDESSMNVQASNEAIAVSEQDAGSSVVVDEVTLSETGWVAIREMKNDVMGNVLGAKRIQNPGTISRVSVELLRPTVAGETYAVVIYRDDGNANFDLNFDSLVVRGDDPVSATFEAQ